MSMALGHVEAVLVPLEVGNDTEVEGGFVGRNSARRHGCARVGMVGGRKVDARCRGSRFWVVGLLVDLGFFVTLSAVSPLSIKLDGLVLPDLERGGDRIHRIDSLFDPFDESLLKHLSEGDVVVTTESQVLFEVLNVLFGGVGGHSDILEFGSSSGGRV